MSAKPPLRFNLLPILLGVVVLIVGAVWWKVSQPHISAEVQARAAAEEKQAREQEAAAKAAQRRANRPARGPQEQ